MCLIKGTRAGFWNKVQWLALFICTAPVSESAFFDFYRNSLLVASSPALRSGLCRARWKKGIFFINVRCIVCFLGLEGFN